jgi:O-antigen/teichoic acid export membrane protein
MSTLKENIVANVLGRAWGVVSIYLFVPLYLKFLGIESYGLVGFYSILLGVLGLADIGLTATLSREMARLSVRKNAIGEMGESLRTYETLYLFISLAVASVIWVLAPFIAERWLNASTLQPQEITSAIRLMGIAVAIQLPSGLYSGGLLGLQKQVLANSLQIGWGVLRGVGAVLVLWLFSPTILAFAFWQLFSNAVYCFGVRLTLWRAVSPATWKPRFNRLVFRDTWRYTTGMAGMAFLSTILIQTDKLVVSKMLSLESFGYYILAGSLAVAPMVLASPIGLAIFPRLTGLVSMGDKDALKKLYHKACKLVSVAVLPGGLTLAAYAGNFIFAWTGSIPALQKAGPVASLLLGGQIMQAITLVPFYLSLAHGQTKLILYVQICSILVVVPLLILLITKYGFIGGGVSWLVMNLCALPPYMYFLHRRLLPGELQTWALHDIGRPLFAALPIILLARWLLPLPTSRLLIFCLIAVVWSVSALAAVFSLPDLRIEIIQKSRKTFGHLMDC